MRKSARSSKPSRRWCGQEGQRASASPRCDGHRRRWPRPTLVTKRKLANFTGAYGATKATFPYGVYLDGEAVETGPELEVHFIGPLAPGRKQTIDEIRQQNQAAGTKGRRICWAAATSGEP